MSSPEANVVVGDEGLRGLRIEVSIDGTVTYVAVEDDGLSSVKLVVVGVRGSVGAEMVRVLAGSLVVEASASEMAPSRWRILRPDADADAGVGDDSDEEAEAGRPLDGDDDLRLRKGTRRGALRRRVHGLNLSERVALNEKGVRGSSVSSSADELGLVVAPWWGDPRPGPLGS